MKKHRAIALIALIFIAAGTLVYARTGAEYLDNGFMALYYHAVRLEETFPRVNPMALAIGEFEKALRDDETSGEAMLMIGMIYQYLDRPGTALGYFMDFARLHPEETWIHSFIGDLYAEMGRLDEAEQSYRLAAESAPEEDPFRQAYVGLGNTALERGDYAQAREAFAKALEDAGDYFDARLGLGKALYYLEDYEEAIAALEVAQLQAPRSIPMFYYLGLSYEAAGLKDQAEHAFSRMKELQESE
ncbi:MAG: tetratricopeptide repeat protein [Bacillota bacterium]|jgi:tetratricopeptide (TPR) repeat protein|nr:tetratricopeptide repeat protein [Bacillota bacterium]NLJ02048.1 tetratricopeptide repeat protein [Bacillota bacterium]